MSEKPRIKALYGPEPMREGEYPFSATVGFDGVTRIEEYMQNLGDHGVLWFDVYHGDTLVKRFGARHVAEIHYETEEATS